MNSKYLHRGLNIAIVLGCALLATVLAQRYYVTPRPSDRTVSVSGVDFSRSKKTLLLFLQQDCGVCIQSLPLYRKLVDTFQDPTNVQLVLITPTSPMEAAGFFEKEGLSFHTVLQGKSGLLGVRLSPTLILVDSSGTAYGQWIGELSTQQESHLWLMLKQ